MAGKIRGITIELSADATGVLDGLKSINSEIKSTSSQLKDVDKLLKLDPGNMTLLAQKTQLLQEQIENTKEKLDKLKKAQQDMDANGVDKNSEQYQALQREIVSTEQELKNLEKTAGSGSAALMKISEVTGTIGDKMQDVGKKMSIVSAALAALGAAAVSAFNQVDEGSDIVIKKTGATGDAAEELEQSYKNVAKNIVADWTDIGSAVGEVSTRFQLTGGELEELSEEFLKFANINKMDVTQAVSGVDMAMKTFNVDQSEANNVMGLLTKTSQDTGISMDTLLGLLQSSGDTFKEMGLDLGSSVTLMGQFEAAGIDSNTMLGKMSKAAAYFSKKGLDMNTGLSDLITRLQDSSTEADATAEVYEIFGSKAGLAFINAAKEGKISIDGLSTAMNDYGTIVDSTYQQTLDGTDKMALAWQNMQLGLAELGAAIGETLAPIMDKITEVIQGVVDWFTNLDDGTKETIVTIGLLVAAIGPLLVVGGKVMSGISSITSALSAIGTSTAGPIGLVIAATAALVTGVVSLKNGLHDAYVEASPFAESIDQIRTANDELSTSIANTKQAYEDSSAATEAQAGLAQNLYKHLQDLIKGYDGTAEKQAEIEGTIKTLNETVPGLGLAWDGVTNSLNLTNDEIYANIEAMRAQAEVAALQEMYTESLKEQYAAEKNLTEARETAVEVLSRYGLNTQDVIDRTNGGVIAEAAFAQKLMASGVAWYDIANATEEVMLAFDGYMDASANASEASGNVTFAEEKLGEAMSAAAEATANAADSMANSTDQSAQMADNAEKTAEAYVDTMVEELEEGEEPIAEAAEETVDNLDVTEEAGEYGDEAGSEFVDSLDSHADGAAEAAQNVKDSVTDTMSGLPGEMSDTGDESGSNLESAYSSWKGAISGAVDDTYNFFYDTLGTMLTAKMYDWGYEAGTKYRNALDDRYSSITSMASDIADGIEAEFEPLAGWLESAGYDGGAGLYNGLVSWEGALIAEANYIAWQISSTIRAAWQSHSPSKLFTKIGESVGQGLEIGIEDSGRAALSAASELAGSMIGTMDGLKSIDSAMNANVQSTGYAAGTSNNSQMISMLNLLTQYLPYLAEDKDIRFDDGTWAGVLAPSINREFEKQARQEARG